MICLWPLEMYVQDNCWFLSDCSLVIKRLKLMKKGGCYFEKEQGGYTEGFEEKKEKKNMM